MIKTLKEISFHKEAQVLLFLLLSFSLSNFFAFAPLNQANLENLRALSIEDLMNIKVHSVSKFTQTLENAPASVIVINHEQIVNRGYFDLSDVLKALPGIDRIDHARGFGEFYTMRGIEGNDRFLVFVDNQKVNPSSGTFLSVGYSLSIRFAERIEIVLGPASALYGADAFSGIIHIFNPKPDGDQRCQVYASRGSENTSDYGLSWRLEINELKLRFQARGFHSDGPDFLGDYPVYDSIQDYLPPLVTAFEQPIDDHNLNIRADFKHWSFSYFRQQFDEGNAYGQHPRSNIYNQENKWKTQTDILGLNFNQNLGRTGSINARLSWIKHVQDPETQFFKTLEPYAFDKLFSQYMTGEDKTWKSEISYVNQWSEKLQFIVGIEAELIESIPPYANDQVLGTSAPFIGENARLIREQLTIKEKRQAVFSQFELKTNDSITYIIGGRFDQSERHSSSFNPRVGFILKPGSNTLIKTFFGTAFQAPSLFLQYEQWGSINAVMLSVDELQATTPGWHLDHQKTESLEVTISHTFKPALHLQASIYQHRLKNMIERVHYTDSAFNKYFSTPENPVYSLGFRNENIGIQKINGLDLTATFTPANHWEGYFWYSFTDANAKKDSVESPIPRIAKHKAAIGLTAHNFFGFLGGSLRFKWVGEINNRNAQFFPDGTQPGYNELDLYLTASSKSKHCHFFLRIQNLFDRHIEHGGLFDQVILLPTVHQPGLTASMGLEYVF